jgi:RNA polymerase sigma-70 factor (ECF subfamily)
VDLMNPAASEVVAMRKEAFVDGEAACDRIHRQRLHPATVTRGLAHRDLLDRDATGATPRELTAPLATSNQVCVRICTLALIPIRSDTANDDAASTDEALVGRARTGDRAALDALLRRHYDRMYAVCRRMTGNDADAADATQNALIAVVRGLPGFDVRSQFSTWAYRIAVNSSIDELRRRSRRPAASLDEITPMRAETPDDTEQSADRIDVDAALRQLPPPFRAAVVLRDMCGLDYAEIAEILDLPPGTVRSRIARGRGALVRLLDPKRRVR